jgi:hypothetical protein
MRRDRPRRPSRGVPPNPGFSNYSRTYSLEFVELSFRRVGAWSRAGSGGIWAGEKKFRRGSSPELLFPRPDPSLPPRRPPLVRDDTARLPSSGTPHSKPDSKLRTPDSGLRTPDSKLRTLLSRFRDPDTPLQPHARQPASPARLATMTIALVSSDRSRSAGSHRTDVTHALTPLLTVADTPLRAAAAIGAADGVTHVCRDRRQPHTPA